MYETEQGLMVAACDKELLGQTFKEGKLHLHVKPDFYMGEEAEKGDVLDALGRCATANLVGERVVAIGIKAGVIDPEGVITIGGVPHAQLYRF